jgi:hypothetical protein
MNPPRPRAGASETTPAADAVRRDHHRHQGDPHQPPPIERREAEREQRPLAAESAQPRRIQVCRVWSAIGVMVPWYHRRLDETTPEPRARRERTGCCFAILRAAAGANTREIARARPRREPYAEFGSKQDLRRVHRRASIEHDAATLRRSDDDQAGPAAYYAFGQRSCASCSIPM